MNSCNVEIHLVPRVRLCCWNGQTSLYENPTPQERLRVSDSLPQGGKDFVNDRHPAPGKPAVGVDCSNEVFSA